MNPPECPEPVETDDAILEFVHLGVLRELELPKPVSWGAVDN